MGIGGYANAELRIRPGQTGTVLGEGTAGDKAGRTAQKEILLRLMAQGTPLAECSKILKTSGITLALWARQPEFLERLKTLNEIVWREFDENLKTQVRTTMGRIQQASDEALDKVLHLMENANSEQVQLKAAQDILDRNPETSKTKKIEKREAVVHIDAKLLTLAAEAEREITIDGQ